MYQKQDISTVLFKKPVNLWQKNCLKIATD